MSETNCTHSLPSTLCTVCTGKRKRPFALEDCYDLEDEINPNPGRYVPTAEELARLEENRQQQDDYQETLLSLQAASHPF